MGGKWWRSVYRGRGGTRKQVLYEGGRGDERGEMRDAMPVVVIKEEKEKPHKTWYITLYEKLFGEKHQKYKVGLHPKSQRKLR